ncbi:MAG: hypothetical protein GDA40_06565 [Rhodobacteraceae bacterium]|nr:hypothetical protein [Paracoccaceae bacterium]
MTFAADLGGLPDETLSNADLQEINGVSIVGVQGTGGNSNVERYGAWMEHSSFYLCTGVPVASDTLTLQDNQTFTIADSFGIEPPQDPSPDADGTFLGAMVGTPPPGVEGHGEVLVGAARLEYNWADDILDAAFSNIINLDRNGAGHSVGMIEFSNQDINFDRGLIIGDAALSDGRNSIDGRFYGGGDEISGTFEHPAIIGAFGAKLQPGE